MAKCNAYVYAEYPVAEDLRNDLEYTGSVGDFDRLVADGYSPEEAHEMIIEGRV